jgi:coenzyme F420-reducing hydrogenase alpha subunit
MAKDHADTVRHGLALKKAGNSIVNTVGGREVHPINVKVGGFYKVPRKADFAGLLEELKRARELAQGTVAWVSTFDFPDCERDYEFVALRPSNEYPFCDGHIASNKGLDISARDYDAHFEETHAERTTALRSHLKERGAYLCGPMARYSLNFDRLSEIAKEAAKTAGLGSDCRNPYKSIIVRSVEVLQACDEAIRIIENYQEPDAPSVEATPVSAVGCAATEAPRGLLYHRYRIEPDGTIADAKIVPPTSQNQASIEEDLTAFIPAWLDMPDDKLKWRCEQTVRNYDPCISCATHFLRLEMDWG